MLDLLETDVDERYYIRQKKVEELVAKLKDKTVSNAIRTGGHGSVDRHSWDLVCAQINHGNVKIKGDNICSCIDANYHKGLDNHAARTGIMQVGMLDIKGNEQIRRVYDPEGSSPTLSTMQGGNTQPKILVVNKLNFIGGIGNKDWAGDGKKLSRNYPQGNRVYSTNGVAVSQTANGGGLGGCTGLYLDNYRIRRLTPLECWRLMGFRDEDYWIARRSLEETFYNGKDRSNSQMYKMAGNSIVVNVLEYIFKQLMKDK